VEVSPNSTPPVCKIMDYGKYLYEQKKKYRKSRHKSQTHKTSLKEIRLRPGTGEHDLEIKLKHAREFLEKGHKVQFSILFRGRQMLHKDKGYEMLDDITERISDIARIEQQGKMSGKRLTLLVVPR